MLDELTADPSVQPLPGRRATAKPATAGLRFGRVSAVGAAALTFTGLPGTRVGDIVALGTPPVRPALRDRLAAASSATTFTAPEPSPMLAEVVNISADGCQALPLQSVAGVDMGARVYSTGGPLTVKVGEGLLGRVVNGLGVPIDGSGELTGETERCRVTHPAPDPLSRPLVRTPLSLGVRALDTLVTAGAGQRLGIMAGSGVGKSSLLSMISRGTEADVVVLALIGERGREVGEFLTHDLGPEGRRKAVVVVATSDAPAVERVRAAFVATRIAEWFRDTGRNVLLLMDSLTRVAMAQREIGLAAGEPAATRGYPPSSFGILPGLLERAGTSTQGSITGLYTVLVEGDDLQDPIGDTARSILDGHIVLDRKLATAGHFPAIEVLESISRVARAVTGPTEREMATRMRQLMAARRDVVELVQIGAYVPGTNPTADEALRRWSAIEGFLRQDIDRPTSMQDAWLNLAEALA